MTSTHDGAASVPAWIARRGNGLTDWFVHDAAEGRVGPLTTEDLRERYRQRRVQRDTLVWHAGMREWQPLDRVSDQVGIDDVVQDTSRPPPLPPPMVASRPASAAPPAYGSAQAHHAPPPRKGMSGCAIVAIVLAVLAIPCFSIVAAIALPAYQDYTIRAKLAQGVMEAQSFGPAILAERERSGRCAPPVVDSVGSAMLESVSSSVEGRCTYRVRITGLPPKVAAATVDFIEAGMNGAPTWSCRMSVESRYVPSQCRDAL